MSVSQQLSCVQERHKLGIVCEATAEALSWQISNVAKHIHCSDTQDRHHPTVHSHSRSTLTTNNSSATWLPGKHLAAHAHMIGRDAVCEATAETHRQQATDKQHASTRSNSSNRAASTSAPCSTLGQLPIISGEHKRTMCSTPP
jgi:hypothetical protein